MSDLPAPSDPTLKDLLAEGFCLLALLRCGARPLDAAGFHARLEGLVADFQEQALGLGKPMDAVKEATYAFCALADEVLLATEGPLREGWERAPLQLTRFGEHLAGVGFFFHLDRLRQDPGTWAEALEVFHACLLQGFQGKHYLEPPERLQTLTDRLGQELERVLPPAPGFAPQAIPQDRSITAGRRLPPPWAFGALAGGLALALYFAFALSLKGKARAATPEGAAWNPPAASSL
jgi:type VI secretion system protein ImpK